MVDPPPGPDSFSNALFCGSLSPEPASETPVVACS